MRSPAPYENTEAELLRTAQLIASLVAIAVICGIALLVLTAGRP